MDVFVSPASGLVLMPSPCRALVLSCGWPNHGSVGNASPPPSVDAGVAAGWRSVDEGCSDASATVDCLLRRW